MSKLFEAFLWIAPEHVYDEKISRKKLSTKVVWSYPPDISHITKEFKEIPYFCFPDLEQMAPETISTASAQSIEHYTFTLTDSAGERMYGICMRALPHGLGPPNSLNSSRTSSVSALDASSAAGLGSRSGSGLGLGPSGASSACTSGKLELSRRYDLGRRFRHCLCIVTRYPFLRMFRVVLSQVLALSLMEHHLHHSHGTGSTDAGMISSEGVSVATDSIRLEWRKVRAYLDCIFHRNSNNSDNSNPLSRSIRELTTGSDQDDSMPSTPNTGNNTSSLTQEAENSAQTVGKSMNLRGPIILDGQHLPGWHRASSIFPPKFRITNLNRKNKNVSVSLGSEVPILPLFSLLGPEKFFRLLSAMMTERRILLVADRQDTLSHLGLAALAMLHPFQWHHIFIPLLPSALVNYVNAPMPYIIGVRRYMLAEVMRCQHSDHSLRSGEDGTGFVLVDLDSGEFSLHGSVTVCDMIGDSGNALKVASEGFDRVRAKASGIASKFFGKVSKVASATTASVVGGGGGSGSDSFQQLADSPVRPAGASGAAAGVSPASAGDILHHQQLQEAVQLVGPRDIFTMMLNDLRSNVVATNPEAGSAWHSVASAVTGQLFKKGFPGFKAGGSREDEGIVNYTNSSSSTNSNSSGGSHRHTEGGACGSGQHQDVDAETVGKKSFEEAKLQWAAESEKLLRENLAALFVYLFADLDSYFRWKSVQGGHGGPISRRNRDYNDSAAGADGRSKFQLRDFLLKRNQMGDSKAILEFLNEFVLHSQMFEQYCDQRAELIVERRQLQQQVGSAGIGEAGKGVVIAGGATPPCASTPPRPGTASLSSSSLSSSFSTLGTGVGTGVGGVGAEEDLFEAAMWELLGKHKQQPQLVTIRNVKHAVQACSNAMSSAAVLEGAVGGGRGEGGGFVAAGADSNPALTGEGKVITTNFHDLTMRFTSGHTDFSRSSAFSAASRLPLGAAAAGGAGVEGCARGWDSSSDASADVAAAAGRKRASIFGPSTTGRFPTSSTNSSTNIGGLGSADSTSGVSGGGKNGSSSNMGVASFESSTGMDDPLFGTQSRSSCLAVGYRIALALEAICADAGHSRVVGKIFRTIEFRLNSSVVAGFRGSSGRAGWRALSVLRALLISGPECALTMAIDLLPILQKMMRFRPKLRHLSGGSSEHPHSGSTPTTGTDYAQMLLHGAAKHARLAFEELVSSSHVYDPRSRARVVLSLMMDHAKLNCQRRMDFLRRSSGLCGFVAYTGVVWSQYDQIDHTNNSYSSSDYIGSRPLSSLSGDSRANSLRKATTNRTIASSKQPSTQPPSLSAVGSSEGGRAPAWRQSGKQWLTRGSGRHSRNLTYAQLEALAAAGSSDASPISGRDWDGEWSAGAGDHAERDSGGKGAERPLSSSMSLRERGGARYTIGLTNSRSNSNGSSVSNSVSSSRAGSARISSTPRTPVRSFLTTGRADDSDTEGGARVNLNTGAGDRDSDPGGGFSADPFESPPPDPFAPRVGIDGKTTEERRLLPDTLPKSSSNTSFISASSESSTDTVLCGGGKGGGPILLSVDPAEGGSSSARKGTLSLGNVSVKSTSSSNSNENNNNNNSRSKNNNKAWDAEGSSSRASTRSVSSTRLSKLCAADIGPFIVFPLKNVSLGSGDHSSFELPAFSVLHNVANLQLRLSSTDPSRILPVDFNDYDMDGDEEGEGLEERGERGEGDQRREGRDFDHSVFDSFPIPADLSSNSNTKPETNTYSEEGVRMAMWEKNPDLASMVGTSTDAASPRGKFPGFKATSSVGAGVVPAASVPKNPFDELFIEDNPPSAYVSPQQLPVQQVSLVGSSTDAGSKQVEASRLKEGIVVESVDSAAAEGRGVGKGLAVALQPPPKPPRRASSTAVPSMFPVSPAHGSALNSAKSDISRAGAERRKVDAAGCETGAAGTRAVSVADPFGDNPFDSTPVDFSLPPGSHPSVSRPLSNVAVPAPQANGGGFDQFSSPQSGNSGCLGANTGDPFAAFPSTDPFFSSPPQSLQPTQPSPSPDLLWPSSSSSSSSSSSFLSSADPFSVFINNEIGPATQQGRSSNNNDNNNLQQRGGRRMSSTSPRGLSHPSSNTPSNTPVSHAAHQAPNSGPGLVSAAAASSIPAGAGAIAGDPWGHDPFLAPFTPVSASHTSSHIPSQQHMQHHYKGDHNARVPIPGAAHGLEYTSYPFPPPSYSVPVSVLDPAPSHSSSHAQEQPQKIGQQSAVNPIVAPPSKDPFADLFLDNFK